MNRQDVLNAYSVIDGTIHSPGKFERESLYMPYIFDLSLDGGCEDFPIGSMLFTKVELNSDDHNQFPEFEGKSVIWFYETDNGFIVECNAPSDDELEGLSNCEGD